MHMQCRMIQYRRRAIPKIYVKRHDAVYPRNWRIASGTHTDSIMKRLNTFYIDQFRHFQDPRAPYFMFMSKDGKLAMGVGGLIRMRGYFDWDGLCPQAAFLHI